jgi:hypothetical protein
MWRHYSYLCTKICILWSAYSLLLCLCFWLRVQSIEDCQQRSQICYNFLCTSVVNNKLRFKINMPPHRWCHYSYLCTKICILWSAYSLLFHLCFWLRVQSIEDSRQRSQICHYFLCTSIVNNKVSFKFNMPPLRWCHYSYLRTKILWSALQSFILLMFLAQSPVHWGPLAALTNLTLFSLYIRCK